MEETTREASSRRTFWLVLSVATALRMLLAAVVPLSGDEAYYWDCSRHQDWSYFDQPPLVIWSMIPFRLLLGETSLAIRMPAIIASLGLGLSLPPLARRLGGGYREATHAYLWMCTMPLFLAGSFYASTDIAMIAFYVATTYSAVALAQGERRAWWGFGLALGLASLAKFPGVLALSAIFPALLNPTVRRQLATPTPWLAAVVALAVTLPVWIWGAQHGWDNFYFQLEGRQQIGEFGAKHLAEFVIANMLLASPVLFVAMALAWRRGLVRKDAGWKALAVAAACPFVFFGVVSLRTEVGGHWGAPGLVLGATLFALTPYTRSRQALAYISGAFGGLVTAFALIVLIFPVALFEADWTRAPWFGRIRAEVLNPLVGNTAAVREIERRRRPDELVASESYTNVHLFAFLAERQQLSLVLADINDGEHGLASLYWHTPDEFEGRDVLFVTRNPWLRIEQLAPYFAHVEEVAPIEIRRDGELVRYLRLFRGTDLRHATPAFSRLDRRGS